MTAELLQAQRYVDVRNSDAAVETDLVLVVSGKQRVADNVVEITLRPAEHTVLPAFSPGAHIDLMVDPLMNTADARVRQYSWCGPDDGAQWRIAVLREGDGSGTSTYVHDRLRTGEKVRVRGPRNHFPLEPAAGYLFIAGGVGITPLLPMLAAAQRDGADWQLVYCGRSRQSMAYAGDLAATYPDRVRINARDECGPMDVAELLRAPRRAPWCTAAGRSG